jgi:hypothetical protein
MTGKPNNLKIKPRGLNRTMFIHEKGGLNRTANVYT